MRMEKDFIKTGIETENLQFKYVLTADFFSGRLARPTSARVNISKTYVDIYSMT